MLCSQLYCLNKSFLFTCERPIHVHSPGSIHLWTTYSRTFTRISSPVNDLFTYIYQDLFTCERPIHVHSPGSLHLWTTYSRTFTRISSPVNDLFTYIHQDLFTCERPIHVHSPGSLHLWTTYSRTFTRIWSTLEQVFKFMLNPYYLIFTLWCHEQYISYLTFSCSRNGIFL